MSSGELTVGTTVGTRNSELGTRNAEHPELHGRRPVTGDVHEGTHVTGRNLRKIRVHDDLVPEHGGARHLGGSEHNKERAACSLGLRKSVLVRQP